MDNTENKIVIGAVTAIIISILALIGFCYSTAVGLNKAYIEAGYQKDSIVGYAYPIWTKK